MTATFIYVDSSALIATLLHQKGSESCTKHLLQTDKLVSSELLIHEVSATLTREEIPLTIASAFFDIISFIDTEVDTQKIEKCLSVSYLRGADLFHLTAAVKFADIYISEVLFLTLDNNLSHAAKKMGFQIL